MPQLHISYYSLEKRASLQYRGLQFWRRYIESQQTALNAYFRFDTTDIFDYRDEANYEKLPKRFFDFITISHCFFYEPQQRVASHKIYQRIFEDNLSPRGHVLLIVQGTKLFKIYNVTQSEDTFQEERVIQMFVKELGLQLTWYKYVTSTDKRVSKKGAGFGKYAKENLPKQKYINSLQQQYLGQQFVSHYAIDDYVILAKR